MTYPSNSESVAQDQLKAFVERIMRMREEARAINDDIREIYAEAKGNGFDKTVLGKVVSYVEKRQKDAASVDEQEALFDLYLSALNGVGTVVATHVHETPKSQAVQAADLPAEDETPASLAGVEGDEDRQPIPHPEAKASEGKAGEASLAEPDGDASRASDGAGTVAETPNPEAVNLHAERIKEQFSKHASAPKVGKVKESDPPHRDCLKPDVCKGWSNLGLCQDCKEAAAMGQVA